MTNRITGLATGMDVDEIVKSTMTAYTMKVNSKQQQMDVLEIKQKLYRDIISEGQDFYNNYFDLAKSGNLIKSTNYSNTSFTATTEGVASATGLSDAIQDDYTIDVTELAKSAKVDLSSAQLTDDIEITSGVGSIRISQSEISGKSEKEIAKYITEKGAKIGVKAVKSDFKSGLSIETVTTGSDKSIKVNVGGTIVSEHLDTEVGRANEFNVDDILDETDDEKAYKFTVDGTDIIIKNVDLKNSVSDVNTQIETLEGEIADSTITPEEKIIKEDEIEQLKKQRPSIINLVIQNKLSEGGMEAELSDDLKTITVSSVDSGATVSTVEGKYVEETYDSSASTEYTEVGSNLKATIKNSIGEVTYDDTNISKGNSVTLDGVKFEFENTGSTVLKSKSDVEDVKKKIVTFVNDYNKYLEKLSTLATDIHDRSYSPLTEDQKADMSENEIKLWNEKVEKGLLGRDTDLDRIVNNIKLSMTSFVKGAGVTLKQIGINQVKNYGTKNGMVTIDEDKLTDALEDDMESVMNLFTQMPDDGDVTDTYNTGILYRMKDVFNTEFVSTTKSNLIKKAGMEGTASFTQNTLSIQIKDYQQKIDDMNDALEVREQALYTKWANIETLMNNYNSQASYLTSMFGGTES